jgi:hypothetical protein
MSLMKPTIKEMQKAVAEWREDEKRILAYESCRRGVTGCINCNNYECKNGSLFVEMGNSCENRIFEADDELCEYINSQNH